MTATNVSPSADHANDARQLRIDLAKLTARAQFALDLSYREHMTQPQIAVKMLLTEPAVRRLLSGALQDLAQIIIETAPPILAAPAA